MELAIHHRGFALSTPRAGSAPAAPRLAFLGSPQRAALLVVAAVCWLVTASLASDMGAMAGTMGLGVVGFVGVWTLMMAAMMLPSISPLTGLYLGTLGDHRARRSLLLAAGYLTVWAAFGIAAFVLAAVAERLAANAPGWAQATAVGICIVCGIYQMTSLKDRCLARCRTPLGQLLRYRSMIGPLVDVRVGVSHGAWCVSCCWSLMVVLIAFGVMNLIVMVVLAAVILVEKLVAPGRWFSILVGAAAFALAVGVWIDPALAPGLHWETAMTHTMMGGQ